VHRDWGYAPDYVDAMIRITDNDEAGDFIVATGQSHSVREFVAEAFGAAGVSDWEKRVVIDPQFYRPADPEQLVGDSSKLRSIGWKPTVDFAELVRIMVDAEFERQGGRPA
jgi:GDPmannose 4,6-dehydratase